MSKPKLSPFNEVLEKMRLIHESKAHDYTRPDDPLGNFMESERVGVDPAIGCFVRLMDKYSRACNLMSGIEAAVEDETIDDTLTDLAVYSILTLLLVRQKRGVK